MSLIYTAEITVYDPALPGSRTLFFASDEGFTSRTSDSPSDTVFEPRIMQPALLRRDAFDKGTTGGRSRVGYGELILNNADGGLDSFIDYGLDSRELVIRVGDPFTDAYPAGFTTILRGSMTQPEVSATRVRIPVRDRQYLIPKESNLTRYAGTNVLPAGVEGVEDLAGLPKPQLWGKVYNVTPVLVNSSRLIFQVKNGAISDVPAAYDRGSALTKGANYSSQADMETNAPSAGNYRVWPAGGMFRLGSSLTGLLTCDVTEGATAADRTAAQVFKALLTTLGGVSVSDISASDLTDLDAANSAEIGVYASVALEKDEQGNLDPEPIRTLLDYVARSVGAWWATDISGLFRIKRLEAPSGSPVVDLSADNVIAFDRVATQDPGNGIPAYRALVRCVPNWTPQTSDLASGVTAARRGILAQPYQTATATDTATLTKHPNASVLDVPALFATLADGTTEAARLLALYGVRRDRIEARVNLTTDEQAALDLGAVVRLTYPRYGYDAGKLFRVLGYQLDSRRGTAVVTLWG